MSDSDAARALRARMLPGRVLRLPDPGLPPHLGRFRVELDAGPVPAYRAGQYLTLGLETPQGFVARPYSIASCPFDRAAYELYIVRIDGGRLTPQLFAAESQPCWVLPPKGRFTLSESRSRTVVMVATGTGIAPFVSQVRTLHRLREVGIPAGFRVILMHGCAHGDEFGYQDELSAYAAERAADFDFTYLATASRPDPARGWSPRHGSGRVNELFRSLFDLPTDARRPVALPEGVDKAKLRNLIRDEPATLMVCGNPGMIDDLRTPARQLGMVGFLVEEYWKAPSRG